MTRRIVQIAAVGHENNEMWQGRTELFALCDDSTAWYQVHGEAAWVPIPDIPQDTPAESPGTFVPWTVSLQSYSRGVLSARGDTLLDALRALAKEVSP